MSAHLEVEYHDALAEIKRLRETLQDILDGQMLRVEEERDEYTIEMVRAALGVTP